jgi:superfamily II DNA or RNA helicase
MTPSLAAPIELRYYQQDALSAIAARARDGIRRPAINLPTGCGKTIIFSSLIHNARTKGVEVLVLAHRDELLEQAADKLHQVAEDLDGDVGFCAARRDEWDKPITIASVQTLQRPNRMERLLQGRGTRHNGRFPYGLVIVDEAHHSASPSYQYVLESLGCFEADGPITLGVSATMQRADNLDNSATFQEIVYHRDMLSMIREGYLCDITGIAVRLAGFDPNELHYRGGEFVASESEEALEAADAPEHVVQAWLKHAVDEDHPEGRKTLLFTPTIKMADMMADAFNEAGVPAVNVSTAAMESRERRHEVLRDFREGRIRVMTNAALLTEGYDEPSIECVCVARPTRSKPFYVQMVGRGTRPHPGKKNLLVMDVVGVTDRHDLTVMPSLTGMNLHRVADPSCDHCGHPRSRHAWDTQLCYDDPECPGFLHVQEWAEGMSLLDWDEEEQREGRVVARRVELFDRRNLAWVQANPSLWVLPVNDDQITLRLRDHDGTWDVQLQGRYGDDAVLGEGMDQGYAMGVAEDYARKHVNGAGRKLIAKDAEWRDGPISERQIEALRRWRYRGDVTGLTRGEASDLLSGIIATKSRRGR